MKMFYHILFILQVPYPRLCSLKRLWWATSGQDVLRQPYHVHADAPHVYPFRKTTDDGVPVS